MGWQLGPLSTDCMPDIVDYFYKHARPGDYFVNALTGVGYIHEDNFADNFPADQKQKILKRFREVSGEYMTRIDSRILVTFAEMEPSRLEFLADIDGVSAVFANYGRTHITNSQNLLTKAAGKPVFRAMNATKVGDLTFTPAGRRQAERDVMDEVRRFTPAGRPTFLYVFLANWFTHMEMATNIATGLGPDYVCVRPDQLVDLYKQA